MFSDRITMKPNKYKNTNQMTQYSNFNTSFETSNIKFGDLFNRSTKPFQI